MPLWINQFCELFASRWIAATPADLARVSLLVIVFGWFLSREHLCQT